MIFVHEKIYCWKFIISCVNARGILPAMQQAPAVLMGGGRGVPTLNGGGIPTLDGTYPGWRDVPFL